VPLEKSNIVEASAATGKTFSIGLLVLRLLLEKKIPIQRILMVTFTNAAVAELASRIRKFLKIGIEFLETGEIEEGYKDIKKIIELSRDSNSLSLLKIALSDLDEASIQTIHSFCQESLNSYPLESDQSFGLDLQTDILEIANEAVKDFWRREITGLPEEFLEENPVICLENFQAAVKGSLGGKKLALDNEVFPEVLNRKLDDFQNHISSNKNELVRRIRSTGINRFGENQQNSVVELLENSENLRSWLLFNRNDSKYIYECWEKIFPIERQMALDIQQCERDMISSYF
ncbi:UvrD-helicase domain-containing protein, partial [Longispora fulva]|uniref:UvrD-helicase domain-containing protein n=1 Tax=Longispora fulva TaxID=619741 RepID=UPI00362541BA